MVSVVFLDSEDPIMELHSLIVLLLLVGDGLNPRPVSSLPTRPMLSSQTRPKFFTDLIEKFECSPENLKVTKSLMNLLPPIGL